MDAAKTTEDTMASSPLTKLWISRPSSVSPAISWSSSPFLATFILVAIIAFYSLFPRLSSKHTRNDQSTTKTSTSSSFKTSRPTFSPTSWLKLAFGRASALTFAATIALSTVLAELIFCEITKLVDPAVRKASLEITILALLVLLVVISPALEIHSLFSAITVFGSGKRKIFITSILDAAGLAAWFAAFWWFGQAVLYEAQEVTLRDAVKSSTTLMKGCLERLGIIGVSLMASLAGFAAVSSIWQTFGAKVKVVTDVDVTRKQHGLDATTDLLRSKQDKMHALERKTGEPATESLFTRVVGSFRGGNADVLELQALQLECTGLESMAASLSTELSLLRNRQTAQKASGTAWGKLCLGASYIFSFYCLYRIGATSSATFRRWASPSNSTFASTDPINNILALVAKHWDPSLDRAAWSRQISFFLSGIMLLASFNAVWQTVLLFSRFVPLRLQQSFADNFALLVSQISATYVISSALLLRSNLPREMGEGIEGALGHPLDMAFVEKWFESWFLGVVGITAFGIWVGKKVSGNGEWDDDMIDELGGDVEMGRKMRMA